MQDIRNAGGILAVALLLTTTACAGDGPALERRARAELRSALAAAETDSAVHSLYEDRDHALLWVAADGLTRAGERAIETIGNARRDGLDASAYGIVDALEALELAGNDELSTSRRVRALVDAELAITNGFAALVRDLDRGASTPATVQPAWRITQSDTLSFARVRSALETGADADALDAVRPSHPQYARLSELLTRLYAIREAGGWPTVPERQVRAGDQDPVVAALRARLMLSAVGAERAHASRGTDRNDVFDSGLDRALRNFQARHGLDADGVLDAATVAALNIPVSDRIRTVELNLERWRWMPRELGTRAVLVNIPAYEVRLFDGHRTVLTMKAVVGQPGWPTPIFADTMTHLIVHPYWNVPESILVEELLPSARASAGYLVRNNYEVVDADGRPLTGELDLDDLSPDRETGLRVRQRPGAGNALGSVKFMFPNQDNVYLHDTPAKALFNRTARALSHGCVRVERPRELARFLAGWTGGDPADVERAFAEGENERIDLPRAVPVYLAYFTLWVDDDGTPRFTDDPYGLDTEMTDLIRTARPAGRIALLPDPTHDDPS